MPLGELCFLASIPKIQYNISTMKLEIKDIEDLAKLARLDLTEEEKNRYAEQLSVIFEYFEMLSEVNTDDIPETAQVTGLLDVTRPDVAVQQDREKLDKLIACFPERQARLLKVKAVFKKQSN